MSLGKFEFLTKYFFANQTSVKVYINRKPNPRGKILMDEKPCPPNPSCYVCSDKREIILRVNLEKMEIGRLRDKVLIGALNMIQPDVMELHTNRIIISSDGETDGMAKNVTNN